MGLTKKSSNSWILQFADISNWLTTSITELNWQKTKCFSFWGQCLINASKKSICLSINGSRVLFSGCKVTPLHSVSLYFLAYLRSWCVRLSISASNVKETAFWQKRGKSLLKREGSCSISFVKAVVTLQVVIKVGEHTLVNYCTFSDEEVLYFIIRIHITNSPITFLKRLT